MKKVLCALLCVIICLGQISILANDNVKLYNDGIEVENAEVIIKDGSAYMPLGKMGEILGRKTRFNQSNNMITIGDKEHKAKKTDNLQMVIDGHMFSPEDVNGKSIAPFKEGDKVYVPIRAVAQNCGKKVEWDNNARSIHVTDPTWRMYKITIGGKVLTDSEDGLCLMENDESDAQRWMMKDCQYTPVINKNTGRGISVWEASKETGAKIVTDSSDEAANKLWTIAYNGLKNKNSNLYITEKLVQGECEEVMFEEDTKMTGAELESMLKSFGKDDSLVSGELNLTKEQMKEWQDAKFGMFIHWGLYSILGTGEWSMYNNSIPYEEYKKLMDEFDPQAFDAEEWAQLASDAGMKYMVMTTRHHDGFSLWDSPSSYDNYDSMHAKSNRDFIKEYTDACREKGLKVGLFYSLMDWRFPGYFDPENKIESAYAMKEQVYSQVEELMKNYGKIDVLWYDGGWLAHRGSDADAAWLWDPVKLNTMVREYQPNVVINPRSGLKGDFTTREGGSAVTGAIIDTPWEKCMTIVNGAWGYNPNSKTRPTNDILKIMVDTFTRNGNVLLNVGPDKDGVIPEDQRQCLLEIGEWMEVNGEAVYGTRGGPVQPVDNVYGTTMKDNLVYVHITDYEKFTECILALDYSSIKSATLLDGTKVEVEKADEGIKITVPEDKIETVDTIVKLIIE